MTGKRDELGDYLEGRTTGGGGDTAGGAAGRAEYFADLEAQVANRAPVSGQTKLLLFRLVVGAFIGRWALHLTGSSEAGWVAGCVGFALIFWRPLGRWIERAFLVLLLVCMVAIVATMIGAEGDGVALLERVILFVVDPVFRPGVGRD